MEDDKKKKKNKKKKNKQNNQQAKLSVEDTSSNFGETSSQDHNLAEEPHHSNQASGIANGGLDDGSNTIVEGIGGPSNSNGALNSLSIDHEKHKWLQEETRLKEMVKQLLYEKDAYIRSQADLESSLKQLQFEIGSWHQKEVSLEQRISQLVQEKAHMSSEEGLLKEKIRHIEKEKFVLVENENSSKELNTTLNNENTRLRMQVLELEGAQNSLSQENGKLLFNISALESRIQDLERNLAAAISPAVEQKDGPEEEDLNAQIEAAFALVEKLVAENAELVEKLSKLYMELERRRALPISGSEDFSMSSTSAKKFETVLIGDERMVSDDFDSDYSNLVRQSSETAISGEIIQIPLSESEAQDLEAQTSFQVERDEDEEVPITDAPLIGAPFRLISFVAKYVSGADLVNDSPPD